MVDKYLKAFVMTVIILAIGLAAINYFDEARANALALEVEQSALDLQASQQLFIYQDVFKGESVCAELLSQIDSKKTQAGLVLSELEAAQKSSLFPSSGLLQKKFILQNIDLFLLVSKAKQECNFPEIEPILYFYPDKYYCADCAAQAQILDLVASKCSNVRIFAFPADLDIPVVDILAAKYNVNSYPVVVAKGEKISSSTSVVSSQTQILQKVSCTS